MSAAGWRKRWSINLFKHSMYNQSVGFKVVINGGEMTLNSTLRPGVNLRQIEKLIKEASKIYQRRLEFFDPRKVNNVKKRLLDLQSKYQLQRIRFEKNQNDIKIENVTAEQGEQDWLNHQCRDLFYSCQDLGLFNHSGGYYTPQFQRFPQLYREAVTRYNKMHHATEDQCVNA